MNLTRRAAAKQLGGTLLTAAAIRVAASRGSGIALASTLAPTPTTVVSFFLDQPYRNTSGLGLPYQPPRGMRAGQPLAALSEQEFRTINPHG